MNMCLREWPSVAANTLNSNSSPSRFAILTDSFQSQSGRRLEARVRLRAAGGPDGDAVLAHELGEGVEPARSSPGYLCSSHSWMPFLVTPGSCVGGRRGVYALEAAQESTLLLHLGLRASASTSPSSLAFSSAARLTAST